MAVPFSNTKLRVPRGFQNLLEGFAREVLRKQPEVLDLYAFGADYFEALVKSRDEGGVDPAEQGAKQEDRFYNNKAFTEPEIDPSDPQQQDAALAIQTKFRQHAAKQEVEAIREEKAATKIQAGFRGYQGRQEVKRKRQGLQSESPSKDFGTEKPAEDEEVDIDLTDPEVEKAAVKIQAGFKGFKARQSVQQTKEKRLISPLTADITHSPKKQNGIDIELSNSEIEQAAIKIQAGYKGMQTRKELKAKREFNNSQEAEIEQNVDMDLTDPKVERAAVTIQAGLRGMRARREVNNFKSNLQVQSTNHSIDIDLADPDVNQATIKIQAGFRAMQTRREIIHKQDSGNDKKPAAAAEEEEVDIDLKDPEVEKAAIKIQAGFKGFKARKTDKPDASTKKSGQTKSAESNIATPEIEEAELLQEKTDEESLMVKKSATPDEEVDIDLEDPEVEKAAVKIQAGFKGMKTRREMASRSAASERKSPAPDVEASGETETNIQSSNDANETTPNETEHAVTTENVPTPTQNLKTDTETVPEEESSSPAEKIATSDQDLKTDSEAVPEEESTSPAEKIATPAPGESLAKQGAEEVIAAAEQTLEEQTLEEQTLEESTAEVPADEKPVADIVDVENSAAPEPIVTEEKPSETSAAEDIPQEIPNKTDTTPVEEQPAEE